MTANISFTFRGQQFEGALSALPGFNAGGPNYGFEVFASYLRENSERARFVDMVTNLRNRATKLSTIQAELTDARNHPIRDKLLGVATVAALVGLVAFSVLLICYSVPGSLIRFMGALLLTVSAFGYIGVTALTLQEFLDTMNPLRNASSSLSLVDDLLLAHLKLVRLFFNKVAEFESAESRAQAALVPALEQFMEIWEREGAHINAAFEGSFPGYDRELQLSGLNACDGFYHRFNRSSTADETEPPASLRRGPAAPISLTEGATTAPRGSTEEDDDDEGEAADDLSSIASETEERHMPILEEDL